MFKVTPTHVRTSDGSTYRDRYLFDSVDIACALEYDYTDKVSLQEEYKTGELGIVYSYGNKPSIFITENRVFGLDDNSKEESKRQAYFALSMMDSRGCVSRWRKV